MLAAGLGIGGTPRPPGDSPIPAPGRLGPAALSALTEIVGRANVVDDDIARVAHCRGKSTSDLLRIRGGDVVDAPDAVVLPGSHDEVIGVLTCCAASGIAVVPFGGGTSVVGGLAPEAADFDGMIALDLRRMQELLSVDRASMTATMQPGLRGPQAEALLAGHGLTLGHFPQSFEHASIGGYAATRSSGQASAGYGRFDQMVVGVLLATPTGSWRLGRGPANAAGPDLRQLVLGSEGAFGVITELVLAVREAPSARKYEGWQLPSFTSGVELLRNLAQHDLPPTIVRLSDEVETASGLANATGVGEKTAGACYLLIGFEGTVTEVAAHRDAASGHLSAAGAVRLGGELGDEWLAGRFHGPYLRDALLDAGGFAETVETVSSWADLPALYAAVRSAITSAIPGPVLVLCHISHIYRGGASLYFTVICRQPDDPVAYWDHAKRAITDAILLSGGSVTHHHGIGTVHRPWLAAEIGDVGIRVLAAIKREIDPTGVMNPGVLVARDSVGQ